MTSWVQRVTARTHNPDFTAKTDETPARTIVSSVLAVNPCTGDNASDRATASVPRSPWRCYACRGTQRTHRPVWDDWTCDQCRAIVAGPTETERPWRLVRRYGPVPLPSLPRVVWGQARGHLAVHDPATDTWHEIAYREAPPVWQAAVRSRHRKNDAAR